MSRIHPHGLGGTGPKAKDAGNQSPDHEDLHGCEGQTPQGRLSIWLEICSNCSNMLNIGYLQQFCALMIDINMGSNGIKF